MNSELARWVLTGFALLFVLLALVAGAASHEGLLVLGVAAIAVISGLISWIDRRSTCYGLAAIYLAMALAVVLSHDYPRTASGWTVRLSYAFFFMVMCFPMAKRAWRATVVRGETWTKEREQVEQWIALLENPTAPAILHFSSESFWTGYFTYRMLKAGSYWVVAKFKKGKDRIIDCRVLELNAVRPAQDSPGLQVLIDNRPIPQLKISSDVQPRLLAYVK